MKDLRYLLALVAGCVLATVAYVRADDPPQFPRGANRTPFPKIVDAITKGHAKILKASTPPPQVIMVPKRLSMWGNNQYGDCVTAESCFAIAAYSTFIGMPEIFVPEANTIAWARAHGDLNGADLLSVIQDMQKDGIKDENGILRKAGVPSSVDYRNESVLQSALAVGPVSIAIDANALPSGAGNQSGWYSFGVGNFPNTDHCVSLAGYGPTSELFKALGVTPPANAPANGYLLYTWSTIGVVDHQWLLGTCAEAWVRTPTTTDLQPPVPPAPTNVTVAIADVTGVAGTPVKFAPTAQGGTSPYVFLFDYGDAVQNAAGSHTYATAGSYTVTVSAVDSTGKVGKGTCTATISGTPGPGPGPGPTPGPGGLTVTLPQSTPAGTYILTLPSDLDNIQRQLDAIRGNAKKK